MALATHNDPLDEAFDEEPEDEIVPSGMRVVEGDDAADLEEDAGVVAIATTDADADEVEVPKDGLAELDELEKSLDEPPIDMGTDD